MSQRTDRPDLLLGGRGVDSRRHLFRDLDGLGDRCLVTERTCRGEATQPIRHGRYGQGTSPTSDQSRAIRRLCIAIRDTPVVASDASVMPPITVELLHFRRNVHPPARTLFELRGPPHRGGPLIGKSDPPSPRQGKRGVQVMTFTVAAAASSFLTHGWYVFTPPFLDHCDIDIGSHNREPSIECDSSICKPSIMEESSASVQNLVLFIRYAGAPMIFR